MLEPRDEPPPNILDLPEFADDDEGDTLVTPRARRLPPDWWRQRWVVPTAAALIVVVLAGVAVAALRGRAPSVTYAYSVAGTGNLALSVGAIGPVQGAVYDVDFSGSGKLASIDVTVGQHVTGGQKLATLDMTSLQDAVGQAQAAIQAAQTALDDAYTNQGKVQAQTAAQQAAAYDQEQNAIYDCQHPPTGQTAAPDCVQQAQDQYSAAQAQADAQNTSAQTQVDTAQAELNTAQAGLNTAQHNLSNATLTAPHDGTVAVINGTVGGTPGAGAPASGGNVFIVIVDLSSLQVTASVNEADIGGVAVGNQAQFTVSAYSQRTFHGTVASISPLGQTQANVVSYPVTISVDTQGDQGASLLPGMTANVTIITQQRYGVVLVPTGAVTVAQQESAAADADAAGAPPKSQVEAALSQARQMLQQLLTGDTDHSADNPTAAILFERSKGHWIIKPVVLGLTDGAHYEVLAGLAAGEHVVTAVRGPASNAGGSARPRFFGGGGAHTPHARLSS